MKNVAGPFKIEVELVDPTLEARPATSTGHPAVREPEAVLRQVHGPMRVVPSFMAGSTDALHYAGITEAMVNYDGTLWGPDASRGLHGTDERLATKYLPHAVLLHELLMERHVERQEPDTQDARGLRVEGILAERRAWRW